MATAFARDPEAGRTLHLTRRAGEIYRQLSAQTLAGFLRHNITPERPIRAYLIRIHQMQREGLIDQNHRLTPAGHALIDGAEATHGL